MTGTGRRALDPALERFLQAGDPPIVLTLGSSVVIGSAPLVDETLDAVRRLGRRAVLLIGAAARDRLNQVSDSIFVADYAPHASLLPRAAAVIHHGGMGTLAQCMRAGVPMIVVPFVNDQADNAFRASRLGIARVVPRAKYHAARVARELATVLDDPVYRARARAVADGIQREDGLTGACDMLESCVRA